MRKLMVMMAIFWSILSYGKEERVYPSQPPKLDFPMHWSVIAYNPHTGAFGYGDNNMSKVAERAALQGCVQASNDDKIQDCRVVASGNHVYVALAVGQQPNIYGTAQAGYRDPEKAEEKALQQCHVHGENCFVVLSACGK